MNTQVDDESLWKQYHIYVDLYKHYLELVLKFNFFYYAVTGAIVSFYFSQKDVSLIKYSLLFPALMSLGFSIFFIYGGRLVEVVREDIFAIRDSLGLYSAPEMKVLTFLLYLSSGLFITVAMCLFGLFFFGYKLGS